MTNAWVQHVKSFAKKNNLSYGCAMTDPKVKVGYTPVTKSKKQKATPVESVKAPVRPKKKLVIKESKSVPKSAPKTIPEFDPTKDDMKKYIKKHIKFDMAKLQAIQFPQRKN